MEGYLPQPALGKVLQQLLVAGALLHLRVPHGGKKVLPGGEIAKAVIGQALPVAVVQVAVGLIVAGLQREGAEHLRDIELNKAHLDRRPLEGDIVHGHRQDHLLLGPIEVGHADYRLCQLLREKAVPAQAGCGAALGINDTVLIHQGEFIHAVQPLCTPQKAAQGLLGLQVGRLQNAQGVLYVDKIVFQLFGDHLGSAPGQLLQVKLTDPGHRLLCTRPGAVGHPDRSNQQNGRDNYAAPDGGGDGTRPPLGTVMLCLFHVFSRRAPLNQSRRTASGAWPWRRPGI